MLRVNKTSRTQKESSFLETRQKIKKEKLLFYLCEGRQNNLFTPECVLCLEFFPSIVIVCYLNHQINMKRSFHVLLSPEGIWTTCRSFALSESSDKTICHPFFLQVLSGLSLLQRPGLWWATGRRSLDSVLFALEPFLFFFTMLYSEVTQRKCCPHIQKSYLSIISEMVRNSFGRWFWAVVFI